MKQNKLFWGILSGSLGLALIFLLIPMGKTRIRSNNNASFIHYISAYSSGRISTQSTIKIKLNSSYATNEDLNQEIAKDLFSFSPKIKGQASWIDANTIEFSPDQLLPPGEVYAATFHLSKIVTVPDSLANFHFDFETIEQQIEVELGSFSSYNNEKLNWYQQHGLVKTADYVIPDNLKQCVTATQNGKELDITWDADNSGKNFRFSIDSIQRFESKRSKVKVKWDGKLINSKVQSEEEIEVPSQEEFELISVKVQSGEEQSIILNFSDPIKKYKESELQGLISIGRHTSHRFTIEDQSIKVFPYPELSGEYNLSLHPSIKNIANKKLNKKYEQTIKFEDLKPAVRLISKGNILPSGEGLHLPFEAVNLNGIKLKVIKIYESNIPQFLQTNDIDDRDELQRVGKVVFKDDILFSKLKNKPINYSEWTRYTLDLNKIFESEPGAIYRVIIGFSKKNSTYICQDNEENDSEIQQVDQQEEVYSFDHWDYYDLYRDEVNDYYNYRWRERDNPCKSSFYYNKTKAVNILATNIGLIAKMDNSKAPKLNITVTDLIKSGGISGATVELFDYQLKKLASKSTDGNGVAKFNISEKPFLVVAKSGKHKNYLKLHRYYAQSMSSFEVGGYSIQKGNNGFLYGERGVWRPGDTLFLNFILKPNNNEIPKGLPVILDLYNPRGQLTYHMVNNNPVRDFYNFAVATSDDDATGSWRAVIKAGASEFTDYLRIETIKPNRLKVNLEFGDDKRIVGDEAGNLSAMWLHGAIANKLKSKVEMSVHQSYGHFNKQKGFTFNDPASRFSYFKRTIFDGRLDENGNANFQPSKAINKGPGVLRLSFDIKVFEESGNFSVDNYQFPYFVYDAYIGIKSPDGTGWNNTLPTGKEQTFDVIRVDTEGNTIKASAKVEIQIYKIDWHWWWDNYGRNLSNYLNRSSVKPVLSKTIKLTNGKGQIKYKVDNEEWGRYLIRVKDLTSGHISGDLAYFDWPEWAGKRPQMEGAEVLALATDKDKYNVGEEIKISFPSQVGSEAYVSIESGDKVIETKWVKTSDKETSVIFTAESNMAPNVYAYISLIQPHAQTLNNLPIRIYGVIPINVEDPNSHLEPIIKVADKVRPEQKFSIQVSEKSKKAMTYTLAVVDEGLLDLTNFNTPDPWAHFFAKQALNVKTWDIYDKVIGAYGNKLERVISVGGGVGKTKKPGQSKSNRFKPVVRYFGPFHLSKNKTNKHELAIENYVGSVKVMVVAGNPGQYGSAEKIVAVKKPLMVQATLPRVLGPGETVKLPVNVFAMEDNIKDVKIQLEASDIFEVEGSRTNQIRFTKIGDQLVLFNLKTKDLIGKGSIKVTASSGSEKSSHSIEIDIRNPNPPIVDIYEASLEVGQKWEEMIKLPGMENTNELTVEISSFPSIDLENRLKYLMRYPHGCLEQTTSAAFPQLYLASLVDMNNLYKKRISQNIQGGLERLKYFNLHSGGFSYWPGGNYGSDWATSYAGHFIIEAKKQGYEIPSGLLKRWVKYQKRRAKDWQPTELHRGRNSDLDQAYRLYTLALADQANISAMNRLKAKNKLSVSASWRLAAAYAVAGKEKIAQKMVNGLSSEIKSYRELYYTFGSGVRDRAMMLETMILLGDMSNAAYQAREIAKELSNRQWMSTQTTSYCLIAMSKYMEAVGGAKDINAEAKIFGQANQAVKSKKNIVQLSVDGDKLNEQGQIMVQNNSKGTLFLRIIARGTPKTDTRESSTSNLNLTVSYENANGGSMDPSSIKMGTDFIAVVTIHNPGMRGNYQEMALTQIFPSGWEIINDRMTAIRTSGNDYASYRDIRDDRVFTYFNVNARKSKTFRVRLNASYTGKYFLPAIACEAMYDNSINARKAGKWVEVVP